MSEPPRPDSPQAWLVRARSDLALARAALTVPDVLLEDACFHAQQCAEKALKALLIQRDIDFPYTHVVEALLDLLAAAGVDVPPEVDEAVVLTQYAVQARYPGVWGPVTQSEAGFALRVAGWVYAWVEAQLE